LLRPHILPVRHLSLPSFSAAHAPSAFRQIICTDDALFQGISYRNYFAFFSTFSELPFICSTKFDKRTGGAVPNDDQKEAQP